MQALFEIILPVFVVVGCGYVVTRLGFFGDAAIDGAVKFTQNIAIPSLLFLALSEIDVGASFSAPLIVSYYLGAFTSFFLGYAGARTFFGRDPVDAVAIAFCCLFSNTILLGLPITERAFGSGGLSANYAIIAFHAPLCYLLGVTAMEMVRNRSSSMAERSLRVLQAMFRNPFVIAITLGCIVNVTNFSLPRPFVGGIELLAQAALPVALFGLGGILVRYRPEGDMRTALMICAISLFVHPAIVFGTSKAFSLDHDALRSAVLTASMAPGVNTYVFANMYGAARRVVASSVLIATAASIVSVGFWLFVLT